MFLVNRVKSLQESQTLRISTLAGKMKAEGKNVISLSSGEPDFPTSDFVSRAGIEAIESGFTRYTPGPGILELKKAVAASLRRGSNLKFSPSQVIVSKGGKHSLFNAVFALCQEGDEVIVRAPYWVSFPEMVRLAGARPVIVPASIETGYKITPAQLEAAITPATKMLIFNSPSNPTGVVYAKNEVKALMEVLLGRDIFVLSDEMYDKIVYGGAKVFSPARIEGMEDRVIVSNGVSKAYAMTGWRIGYLAGPQWIIDACSEIQSHMTSNPCSIAQKATVAALEGDQSIVEQHRAEFEKRRDFIHGELNTIPGIEVVLPEGAFYIFPSVKGLLGRPFNGKILRTPTELAEYLLDEYNVATVPGEAFGAPENIRLSYATSIEELKEAVKRMREAFQG